MQDAQGEGEHVVCDLRLTVNDLLAQMVYEGNVKVLSDDGTAFTFDSPEGVAWLQMYADMVKDGTVDNAALTTKDDRTGLLIFSAGQAPFYQTGPNLIREVKANNARSTATSRVVPAPVGKSGVIGKGLMGMSVKADTKYPNASMALAQFFTNPRTYDRTVQAVGRLSLVREGLRGSVLQLHVPARSRTARAARQAASSRSTRTSFRPSRTRLTSTPSSSQAVEKALFGNVPVQQALTDAVTEANKLLD